MRAEPSSPDSDLLWMVDSPQLCDALARMLYAEAGLLKGSLSVADLDESRTRLLRLVDARHSSRAHAVRARLSAEHAALARTADGPA